MDKLRGTEEEVNSLVLANPLKVVDLEGTNLLYPSGIWLHVTTFFQNNNSTKLPKWKEVFSTSLCPLNPKPLSHSLFPVTCNPLLSSSQWGFSIFFHSLSQRVVQWNKVPCSCSIHTIKVLHVILKQRTVVELNST